MFESRRMLVNIAYKEAPTGKIHIKVMLEKYLLINTIMLKARSTIRALGSSKGIEIQLILAFAQITQLYLVEE